MAINRIPEFISALSPITDESAIASLCLLEVDYLQSALTPTSQRRSVSRYRNAIRDLDADHIALKYFDVPSEIKKAYREHKDIQVAKKQDNILDIDHDELIIRACQLCSAQGYLKITLGLILLTGRRPVEVLKQGKFYYSHEIEKAISEVDVREDKINTPQEIEVLISKMGDTDYLLFSGQAKTRNSDKMAKQPFPIPILADPEQIMESIHRLRDLKPEFKSLTNDEVHSRANKELNGKTSGAKHPKIYGDLIANEKCSCKGLRAAYAQICFELYGKPNRTGQGIYFSRILGHSENSTSTASHYVDFNLDDLE